MAKKKFSPFEAMMAIERAVTDGKKPIGPVLEKLRAEMETPDEAKKRIEKEG